MFTADALENCTSFSSEISAAIYAGRIVAVYDPIGISQEFDAMLSMPFISVHNLSDEVTVAEENLEYIVIGKFYGVDQTGHIKINNINVPSDLSESEAFEVFYQQLNRFIEKLAINNDYSETPTVAAANDYVRIGEEGGYFLGKEKKVQYNNTMKFICAETIMGMTTMQFTQELKKYRERPLIMAIRITHSTN